MGLDMYLTRLFKPKCSSEDLNGLSLEEIYNRGYYVFQDGEAKPDNYESIAHLAVRATIGVTYTDWDGIKRDYGIPMDATCGHGIYSPEKVELDFSYYRDIRGYTERFDAEIVMSRAAYETKYRPVKVVDADCIEPDNLGYWRKDYELQDAFYDACDVPIENCGYYPLTDEMWEVLAEHDPSTYEVAERYRDDPSCVVCYHEWY